MQLKLEEAQKEIDDLKAILDDERHYRPMNQDFSFRPLEVSE